MIKKLNNGIIIFTKKIKDNDLYIKLLSSNNEIISGMVYGGLSSKKKLTYQLGYFIDYSISLKNTNSPPIINAELINPYIGSLYDNKYKLNAINSIISLINLSLYEGQNITGFYDKIYHLINTIVANDRWITDYCEWLFDLLKLIGYEVDYKNNTSQKFYNLLTHNLTNKIDDKVIEFPHNLFTQKKIISYNNIKRVFIIFESIFKKNHLDNINVNMPLKFIAFKKIILNTMKSKINEIT